MKKTVLFLLLFLGIAVSAQVANPAVSLFQCDDDNDGIAAFDLTVNNSVILGGQNPADFTVTYYGTLAGAEVGVGEIDTNVLYQNIIVNTQTIYVRVEENATGNYVANTTFTLNVISSPVLPSDPLIYAQCEEQPNITDGLVVFDLPSYESTFLYTEIIAAGGNTADYTSTYYTGLLASGDPDPISIIANPSAYINVITPDEVIYVFVVNTNTGCRTAKAITLHVNLVPTANYTPVFVCDDDDYNTVSDGFFTFNLVDYIPNITGGETGLDVAFYTTFSDAENGSGVSFINDPTAYGNTVNPQAIFARVESPTVGCYAVSIVKLHVNPNPTPLSTPYIIASLGNNGVMEQCDGNVDGSGAIAEQQAIFDVTQWETQIINGEVGVSAWYYTSLNDAEAGVNQIITPTAYVNISNPQTIYMRVTNDGTGIDFDDGTGCFTIVAFEIYVPVPEVMVVADKDILCIDQNGVPLASVSLPLLTATAGPAPSVVYDYQWAFNGNDIPGAINQTYSVTQEGDYTVTVSGPTDFDCINVSTPQTIGVSGVPDGFNVSVTSSPCDASQIITASVTSTIPGLVFWYSLDNGQPTTNGTFTDVSDGIHTVTITDGENCWTNSIPVEVLECELAQDNLTVETVSETCVGLDNGMVQITTNEAYTYEVNMSLNGNAIAVSPNTFTDVISIPNLGSGTYYICVTAIEVNATQCYDVYVESVENLVGFSGRIGNVYSLELTGSKHYNVAINDVVTEINVATTTEVITFEHELSAEVTAVKVTTDKECQGRFEETVLLDAAKLVMYPNPVVNEIYFSTNTELSSVVVYDMSGKVVLQKTNNANAINVSELSIGLYFIKATSGTTVFTSKFIKK